MNKIFSLMLFFFLFTSTSFAEDVLTLLNKLPDIEAQETTTAKDIARNIQRFAIQILQPVDHFDHSSGTFSQKLVLFHRNFNEPMVLQTSGYQIYGEGLTSLSKLFETNQLQVEHRFFAGSTPLIKDWSKLTIRQSAEDFHHIVQVFKQLYAGQWVNTGASKGGMTSVYHRRFYPEDVVGTVADVAPMSFAQGDRRYLTFIENVGGMKYADCRARLENFQKILLEQRSSVLPMIEGDFTLLGSKEIAYEHAIVEMPFTFWQYIDPENETDGCRSIPDAQSSPAVLYNFLKNTNPVEDLSDEEIFNYQPYYFQATNELGYPADKTQHLDQLLKNSYGFQQYLPAGVSISYSELAMRDIQSWVANKAEGILFTYGEFDPWSAGAFEPIHENADNHIYFVANGNHNSYFVNLPNDSQSEFIEILSRWFKKKPIPNFTKSMSREKALEDIDSIMRRKWKL